MRVAWVNTDGQGRPAELAVVMSMSEAARILEVLRDLPNPTSEDQTLTAGLDPIFYGLYDGVSDYRTRHAPPSVES